MIDDRMADLERTAARLQTQLSRAQFRMAALETGPARYRCVTWRARISWLVGASALAAVAAMGKHPASGPHPPVGAPNG